jgi:hypothetical protein
VLGNQAAARGEGLWGPLSLSAPLDIVTLLAAGALALRLRRARLAAWEIAAVVALVAMTIQAGRSGIWLLFFVVPPAARALRGRILGSRVLAAMGAAGAVAVVFALARGPLPGGASGPLIQRAVTLARGTPILAEDVIAEQVVLAGGKVWVSDPIDAFPARDQGAYLEWTAGQRAGRRALGSPIDVVLTARGSAAQQLTATTPSFHEVAADAATVLYLRNR